MIDSKQDGERQRDLAQRQIAGGPAHRHRDWGGEGDQESVTDRVEPGSLSIANMLKKAIITRSMTGCCACRASCSFDDIAPTAANIAE